MRGKKIAAAPMVFLVFFLAFNGSSFASPVAEDCCYGFTRLRSGGDVEIDYAGSGATLGDDGFVHSYVFNFYNPGPGFYSVDFDIQNHLSELPYPDYFPPFAFLDTFYASLVFRDNAEPPGCTNCYDWLPMFDMDATGIFNNFGTVSSSPLGDDWLHFTMVFETTHPYVITAFELVDWNGINNDSEMKLANICITPVPVPSTIVLLASGFMATAGIFRRRKRSLGETT